MSGGEEARVIRVTDIPSKEVVERHNASHIPWRSWCKACVFGATQNRRHKKLEHELGVPVFAIDYMYMKSEEEKEKEGKKKGDTEDEEEEKGMPILVLKEKPGE